jgi:hypothetical protein
MTELNAEKAKAEVFETWAPAASRWSAWVKPVLFAVMRPQHAEMDPPSHRKSNLSWAQLDDRTTIYVLDLPGAEGVSVGLDFAERGIRPIPVYNALPAPIQQSASTLASTQLDAIVDVEPIIIGLWRGAVFLKEKNLSPAALPAFLVDSNRNKSTPAGVAKYFDNRSISFPSDFPSAEYLRSAGISRVVLVKRSSSVEQSDLAQTLRRWQDAGLQIQLKRLDNDAGPAPYFVKRPSRLLAVWLAVRAYFLRSESGFGVSVTRGAGG